jgi:hypothetical protein
MLFKEALNELNNQEEVWGKESVVLDLEYRKPRNKSTQITSVIAKSDVSGRLAATPNFQKLFSKPINANSINEFVDYVTRKIAKMEGVTFEFSEQKELRSGLKEIIDKWVKTKGRQIAPEKRDIRVSIVADIRDGGLKATPADVTNVKIIHPEEKESTV